MVVRTASASATTSLPSTRAEPEVGMRMVDSTLTSVVFPAPLGPSRPWISPEAMTRSMSARATTGSDRRVLPGNSRRSEETSTAFTGGKLPGVHCRLPAEGCGRPFRGSRYPGPVSRRATLWSVVAVLAAHNVAGNLWFPQWAYVPANLAIGALVVWLALRSGVAVTDITGPRSWLRRGLVAGGLSGAVVGVGIGLASLVPWASDLFADGRVLGVGTVGLLFHTLVRIPIGTALFEEVAFRGVLAALGRPFT